VVGGAGVEVPPVDLVIVGPIVEENIGPQLIEVEERGGDPRRRGVRLDAPMCKE
jgi:hypothetical protein